MDQAKDLGLDLWEVSVGDDVVFTPRLTRVRGEALGLTLTVSPGGEWPMDCDLSADDPQDRARGLAWHRRQVDVAAALGAEAYTGALYGHPGVIRRRIPPPDELPRTAEGVHALADYAAECGVKIVLEPMSHFRTHLVNTPQQLMTLIDRVGPGAENLYALLDTYHMVTEVTDYAEAFAAAAKRLWGVHACENDRGAPGRGILPWDEIFAQIRARDHDVNVIFESYNSATDFAWRRGMFHDVCPDGDAFVRRSLAFCRPRL